MYYIFIHVKHALQVVFEHVIKKSWSKTIRKKERQFAIILFILKQYYSFDNKEFSFDPNH